jgi:hypothetical protein
MCQWNISLSIHESIFNVSTFLPRTISEWVLFEQPSYLKNHEECLELKKCVREQKYFKTARAAALKNMADKQ